MQKLIDNIMPTAFFTVEAAINHIENISGCKKCNSQKKIIVMDFTGLMPESAKNTHNIELNRVKLKGSEKNGIRIIPQCQCWVKEEEEKQKHQKIKTIAQNLQNSGVPFIFKNVKMDDFINREGAQDMKKMAQSFIDNFDEYKKEGEGLYFYSLTSGNGKSLIGSIIANSLISKGYKVGFTSTQDLLLDIRKTYNNTNFSEKEFLNELYKNDLIILDDFGLELEKDKTDWTINELSLIINNLYEKKLPFVITSNLSLPILLNRLGEKRRISSRILEKCTFIENQASDFRQEKALNKLKSQKQVANA